ncbi:hypothetical protein GCM10022405_36670 [Gibbsiella dentisursi]|uniref:Uncharacterized protein n=1 Tax=Gibbsiella dentisursi TaxID=796890 RepID=A0ABP7LVF2_9GAMM
MGYELVRIFRCQMSINGRLEAWMKNAGIVDTVNLDKSGGRYEVITQSDASSTECSISEVNSYLVSKSDVTH